MHLVCAQACVYSRELLSGKDGLVVMCVVHMYILESSRGGSFREEHEWTMTGCRGREYVHWARGYFGRALEWGDIFSWYDCAHIYLKELQRGIFCEKQALYALGTMAVSVCTGTYIFGELLNGEVGKWVCALCTHVYSSESQVVLANK